ncbi:hypothetical protein ACSQ76_08295 [Roseovarius sp. B08]|uniref:hypothetical protein n=1 Tax=Roseovarius sp. B08 TaxID=3449223 RepID=UPI003EDBE660
MSDIDFGLREKPKKQAAAKKSKKLKPLFFTHILGFIAAVAAAVSIIAMVMAFAGFAEAYLVFAAALSTLAAAALSGAVAEISITLKFIAEKLDSGGSD